MGNIVCLIGRLTRDPELKYTANTGNAMARFTVAIDRNYNKEKKEEEMTAGRPVADFINCVAWGKIAELCGNYLSKGKMTAIQGRIQTGSYTNKQGQVIYTTDVVAESVKFLEWGERKQEGYDDAATGFESQDRPNKKAEQEDFIPFHDDSKIPF